MAKQATATAVTDVVVLVPGFLGIPELFDTKYFSDILTGYVCEGIPSTAQRVQTVFRTATCISPTCGLDRRQTDLLAFLAALKETYGASVRFHLIGHSTGGVDALLLLAPGPLVRSNSFFGNGTLSTPSCSTSAAHWHGFTLASIVTLAAPVSGTFVTDIEIAKTWRGTWRDWINPLNLVWTLPEAAVALSAALTYRNKIAGPSIVRTALQALNPSNWGGILRNVWGSRTLLTDLHPDTLGPLLYEAWDPHTWNVGQVQPCRIMHVVTVAPPPGVPGRVWGRRHYSDRVAKSRLYRELYSGIVNHTSRAVGGGLPLRFDRTFLAAEPTAAGYGGAPVAPLTPTDNDGVVNSERQVLPPGAANLTVAVLADHTDIVGYFGNAERHAVFGIIYSDAHMDEPTYQDLMHEIARFLFPSQAPATKTGK